MPEAILSITKQPTVTGEAIEFSDLHVKMQGATIDVVEMIVDALNRHPDLEVAVSSALVIHHRRKGDLQKYVSYLRLGIAMVDGFDIIDDNK